MMEKDIFTKKLGKRIAKIRVEKELTQVELGKLLKKQKQSIYRLETGMFTPTAYFVYEISKALKVPIGDLMDV